MNAYQELWWQQARSDLAVLAILRGRGDSAPCHQLHYLQMVTEKLSKAFFWRHGIAPPMNHAGFRNFLKFHGTQRSERKRIANIFSFGRFEDLQSWVRSVLPLARQLESLAPNLAQDGPNPEYPWPHANPQYAPALFNFDIWSKLTNTGRGRQLMQVIKVAVERFPEYGGG